MDKRCMDQCLNVWLTSKQGSKKKKKMEKNRQHNKTLNWQGELSVLHLLVRKIWWPPHKGSMYTRNCNGRNYSFYHSWRPSWRPLFAENSRASGGSAPWAPGRGPTAGPWTPPVWGARGALCAHTTVRYAHGFFRPPLFGKSWIRHVHIPPCSSKSLAPRGVDPGGAGGQSPPPPPQWKYWGGGQTYRFAPSPPPIWISSTWKLIIKKKLCNARIGSKSTVIVLQNH